MNEEHFRKLENLYHSASCNEYYAPRLRVTKGEAELVIPVERRFFHAAGAVHGSVYFKALDDAAFFAVNSLVEDVLVVTVSFHVHLLRAISDGVIRARGKVVQSSPRLYVAESVLTDAKNREIGRGSGNFVRTNFALNEAVGYR